MAQHRDQGNLQKKVFNLAYCFRRLAPMMAEKRPGRRNSWEFISWVTSRWQSGNARKGLILLKPRSHPQGHTSSNKATSNPLQTVPAIGDQVFSYRSLWGHSHSSHCTRYKASSHAYVWMAGPPPLSSPILPTSYTQWGTRASKGIYTKRSETVKIPKSRTLWHLKRMVHQF